jgi:ribose transport system ATP-binding protein
MQDAMKEVAATPDEGAGSTRPGAEPLLDVRGVTKSFGAQQALDDVSVTIGDGEFVGLMGPNGAGKSTLIKIIDGVYRPDSGSVRIGGLPLARARSLVGVVHQDLGLVDDMTVLENLCLGAQRTSRQVFRRRAREREFGLAQLRRVGLEQLDLYRMLRTLSPGEKTMVAVARLLASGSRLIIVDEATSTLPSKDAQWLISTLRSHVQQGYSVIMVSHKLAEIVDEVDRQIVLRDGRVVFDSSERLLSVEEAAELISPERAGQARQQEAGNAGPGGQAAPPVLRFAGAVTSNCGPIDLDLRPGEIVGVTGLLGSGFYDLAYLAAGTVRPASGRVEIAPGARIAMVPPHRETEGVFPAFPVQWNLTIGSLRRWRSPSHLLRLAGERAAALTVAERLRITPLRLSLRQDALSGGNQQKVLFGRGLLRQATCFVLCEPTRGVDVGTRAEIYSLVRELKDDGAAILILSSDVQDLFELADRIGAIEDGRLTQLWDTSELGSAELTQLL